MIREYKRIQTAIEKIRETRYYYEGFNSCVVDDIDSRSNILMNEYINTGDAFERSVCEMQMQSLSNKLRAYGIRI